MKSLAPLFTKYPEMAVYLAIGIGYLIGKLKFHGVGFGVVTGSLLGGIFIGNFFHVPVSDQAKAMLFLLFLFRNRLLGRTQFFPEPERRRVAMAAPRRVCARCWSSHSLHGRPLLETGPRLRRGLVVRLIDRISGNRYCQ